ncbi:RNApolymerase 14 kDa subunit [Prunus dulcis]|uniref:RNApolymerase 14 kDa subunit n=1 Tax=Prunus dulcis TaxID=3755 RepID=A0A4Y1R618_PRUDU|nr:RNApolymerase 14 kDa subunit [Prunus dulcis]
MLSNTKTECFGLGKQMLLYDIFNVNLRYESCFLCFLDFNLLLHMHSSSIFCISLASLTSCNVQ